MVQFIRAAAGRARTAACFLLAALMLACAVPSASAAAPMDTVPYIGNRASWNLSEEQAAAYAKVLRDTAARGFSVESMADSCAEWDRNTSAVPLSYPRNPAPVRI